MACTWSILRICAANSRRPRRACQWCCRSSAPAIFVMSVSLSTDPAPFLTGERNRGSDASLEFLTGEQKRLGLADFLTVADLRCGERAVILEHAKAEMTL